MADKLWAFVCKKPTKAQYRVKSSVMVTSTQFIHHKLKISVEIEEVGERLEVPEWLNLNNSGWFNKEIYRVGKDFITVKIGTILLHIGYFIISYIKISSQSWQ